MKTWRLLLYGTVWILCAYILLAVCTAKTVTVLAENKQVPSNRTIIIDAGHGGEDGGATSCSGVLESKINLEIALRLEDLMNFLGYQTSMIRTEDKDIHTNGQTIAQRKVSDLKNRVEYVNRIDNALLISIHQNYFADSRYHGAQVFYADTEGSKKLAGMVQDSLKASLNPGSNRLPKEAHNIYLMDRINCDGVLIECGFLSNHWEEVLLRDPEHQKKLCMVIATSVSNYLHDAAVVT